jgi:hypothetical protein
MQSVQRFLTPGQYIYKPVNSNDQRLLGEGAHRRQYKYVYKLWDVVAVEQAPAASLRAARVMEVVAPVGATG